MPMCALGSGSIIWERRRCAGRRSAAPRRSWRWRSRLIGPVSSSNNKAEPGRNAMTYCCGLLVKDGLVLISDTRTNAGIDNIACYRKLHLFETPGERMLAIATSGNLSISQAVLGLLSEGFAN